MRSSPQVGFSLAISTMTFTNSAGVRGRPRGFDFHLQNSRKPFRCHRMKVSGLTKVRAFRHANRLESNTRVNRVASVARRGLTLRSTYRATCLRRKRFSAAKTQMGPRAEPYEPQDIQQKIEGGQYQDGQRIEFRHQRQDRTPGAQLDGVNQDVQNYCGLQESSSAKGYVTWTLLDELR